MAKKEAKKASDKEEMQRICKELGKDKLYYNTKGEYFTELSYAYASEGGDKKKIGTFVPTSAKTSEVVVEESEKEGEDE